MYEKQYPGYKSPFFKNLPLAQHKRMEQTTYRQIISTVSSLYLKISPRGCSQNSRITYEDIEKNKEILRNQEKSSNDFTKSELSKLNNPIRFTSSPRPKKSSFVTQLQPLKKPQNTIFRKESTLTSHCLDELIDKCENFQPELITPKKELVSQRFYRQNTSGSAYNYIQDLSECLKTTGDQEKILNMMSTLKYNRNSDIGLRNELRDVKAEMLQTTHKIVKLTPYRLWRQNNIAFMSNADKAISSLGSIKN